MILIKGIAVTLYVKEQVGIDNFNNPIYEERPERVDNVIVSPSSSDDIVTSTDLVGKKAIYTLGIPKGDNHNWENSRIEFFGKTWKSFGFTIEGIEEMIPLKWHKKVMVERYE